MPLRVDSQIPKLVTGLKPMKRGKISEHGVGRVRYPAYGGITDLPSLSIRGSEMDEMIGKKFGRLTVIEALPVERYANGKIKHLAFLCECECGNTLGVTKYHLRDGHTKSCGCYSLESRTKHGMARNALYHVWYNIRARITDPQHQSYNYYGAKDLAMEESWKEDFPAFEAYIRENLGPKPTPQHSLDRTKNHLGYIKGNLRWATKREQSNNKSDNRILTFKGVTLTMAQHARRLNLRYNTVHQRISSGWTVEQALGTPTDGKRHKRPTTDPAEELLAA